MLILPHMDVMHYICQVKSLFPKPLTLTLMCYSFALLTSFCNWNRLEIFNLIEYFLLCLLLPTSTGTLGGARVILFCSVKPSMWYQAYHISSVILYLLYQANNVVLGLSCHWWYSTTVGFIRPANLSDHKSVFCNPKKCIFHTKSVFYKYILKSCAPPPPPQKKIVLSQSACGWHLKLVITISTITNVLESFFTK